jgi:hypothetical protein
MANLTLIEKIYVNVCVQCESPGCADILIPEAGKIGNKYSADSVDAWAIGIAEEAESVGWSTDKNNQILCPRHTRAALSQSLE